MTIKILGSGCPNCNLLAGNAEKAIKESDMQDIAIEHVSDIMQITEYGVMSVPAIVIDEEVKAAGRIPDVKEIKEWLKK